MTDITKLNPEDAMQQMVGEPTCMECGEVCRLVKDIHFGLSSSCHWVGFQYEDLQGEIITVNEDARPLDD